MLTLYISRDQPVQTFIIITRIQLLQEILLDIQEIFTALLPTSSCSISLISSLLQRIHKMRVLLLLLLLASGVLAQDSKVCFYTDQDYSGTELCAIEGERVDVYQSHQTLNDEFSSVKVPVGLQVLTFFDDGFHGYSKTFQANTPNLEAFEDKISSFIVQPAQACFYTGKEYTETEYCVSVSDMIDFSKQGSMLNDNFESVKIAPGLLVKTFTDEGFQGRFTWITADTADLGDFNDVITSLIVEYNNEVCFYTDVNYQGQSFCARPGEDHDIWQTDLNDKFSSVRVPHDIFVKAYTDDGFHGWSRMFTEDDSNLNDFNNQITSFVVGFSGVACFYTETLWKGSQFCAPYGDKIDVATNFLSFNDKFQSIIIPDDLQVKAYRHARYEGTVESYDTPTRSFGTFSNMISSFEVTAATTVLYDNFADSDVMALEKSNPFNLTVCSFVNDQGSWKLLYNDSCRSVIKHYACNNIYTPNLWRISSGSGNATDGMSVCQSEFGSDFAYNSPSNAHSNSLLSALTPSDGVWINLFYDAFSNDYSHRVKRSTECGGPNQRACTYDDSLFQSWICSLPVITLFACQEPYCQDGLTRVKVFTDRDFFVCKCPTNHRVRRGLHDAVLGACAQANVVQKPLTGEEIVGRLLTRNSASRNSLQMAWMQSFIGNNLLQERGGWVFANPNNPNDLQVVLAPSSASRPFRSNEQTNPAINLEGAATANA